jgi:hypothetical protein
MNVNQVASTIQILGAMGFGALLGWYVYYINRYRKADVQLSDLVTLVGILGGGAILALFPARTDLFGAYGIGLFAGFFGYFLVLIILVGISKNFDVDWFLDGRRKKPEDTYYIPGEGQIPSEGGRPMEDRGKPKVNT